MRAARLLLAAVVSVTSALVLVGPAPLQGQQRLEETRLLRQAAAQESRGELDAAEATLRTLMLRAPTSAAGLFALERVLRARGAVGEILPVADRFLEVSPGAEGIRHLKLRVLADVDSLDALRAESRAWVALDPADEGPWREVADLWEDVFGPEAALELLGEGRAALGDPRALALETGDLLARLGREEEAVAEWAAALAREPGRDAAVAERLGDLERPLDGARAVVAAVSGEGEADPMRLRAAANVAVELGLEVEAIVVARRLSGVERSDRARGAVLSDLARRAESRGMLALASWAWGELGDEAASPGERRQFDQRLVDASLASGDTAAALEAQRRLVATFTPGSADRRQATARVVRLEARWSESGEAADALAAFRAAFPEAPELDDLGAAVADRLLSGGDVSGAATVLEGIDGPRSNMMRGWILMSRGDVALGRQALLMAVPGLPPAEATGIIQFAGLLGQLSPDGVSLLTEARVAAHQGRGPEAVTLLEEGVDELPPEDRAPVLAEGARLAAESAPERADALRRRILEEHPDAGEAPEAALELARSLAREPGSRAEAVAILEDLITSRPRAAVVPTARRELERLRGSGS